MHYIQKSILDELRRLPSNNYSKINVNNVESGHFRYHLDQLVKDGYVESPDRGVYSLTIKGQNFVDSLSEKSINPKKMPKVITYTLLRDDSKLILQKKTKQPYLGLLNMVGGKVHQGELAKDAILREVFEKTGNNIKEPKLLGIFEIITQSNNVLLSHVIAYVMFAKVDSKDFNDDSIEIIEADQLKDIENLAPDFMPIYSKIINSSEVAFDSLIVDV